MKNLYNRYSPAELDHSIELEERRRIMKEWHDTLKLCFINENLTIQKCLTILNEANLGLRYGYPEFLNICKVHYIIILSLNCFFSSFRPLICHII